MARYLVTGGAGFIGSHLVQALVNGGDGVRVLDDLSTGQLPNLGPVRDRIEWTEGDVRDLEQVQRAAEGVEVIFHQAALASVTRSVQDPRSTHDVCVTGTLNVLLAARAVRARRVVYAASSSAYGNAGQLPDREDQAPGPLSPYAAAKLSGEHYCSAFYQVHGLETVCLRYFNVFGPRQDPDSPYSAVIPLFIKALLAGNPPTIFGDGVQSRDFTYVDNVVEANILAAKAQSAQGKLYNVATGRSTNLLDLVAVLNALLGTNIKPKYGPPRPGEVRHSQADISRARVDLGYSPPVSLEEGLRRSIEYYREAESDRRTRPPGDSTG